MADSSFRLAEWRKSRRLTAADLATKAGFSAPYISHLETGKRRYNQDVLEALALALDCKPADLLGDPPPKAQVLAVEPWAHPEREEGHYIRAWRTHRELTLQDVADLAGMTHANLSRLERGLIPYSQKSLEKLAAALGTDPASLIMTPPEAGEISQLLVGLSAAKRAQLVEIARILTGGAEQSANMETDAKAT